MKHGPIAEYVDVAQEDWAKVTILEQTIIGRRKLQLLKSTPGYECAGSMMRYTSGYYGYRLHETDGTTHGRRFGLDSADSLDKAKEAYNAGVQYYTAVAEYHAKAYGTKV